ncbi:MAG: hypothetical protein C0503_03995 [Gemmatimonas sp.]|nr:hypothetical protein [Gemmatimonas sp.]
MPVVEVVTPNGVVDLHNDFLVTAVLIRASDASVRITFERAEHVVAGGDKKSQSRSSLTLALRGVSGVQLNGSLNLGTDACGLDFLRYVADSRDGPIIEVRFDSQSALVVRCQSCSLEDSSARLHALPGRGGSPSQL